MKSFYCVRTEAKYSGRTTHEIIEREYDEKPENTEEDFPYFEGVKDSDNCAIYMDWFDTLEDAEEAIRDEKELDILNKKLSFRLRNLPVDELFDMSTQQ